MPPDFVNRVLAIHPSLVPVVLQLPVPVLEGDTLDTLEGRVFAAECEAYPAALQRIAEGRVPVQGRRVRIDPGSDKPTVVPDKQGGSNC